MTQQLEQAFAEASKLSVEDQIAFAAWIRAELDSESRWTELFAQSSDMLARLADEALDEYESGETLPLEPQKL